MGMNTPSPSKMSPKEVALLRAAQAGDDGAKNALFETHKGLIGSVCNKFKNPTIEWDDLYMAGVEGFFEAVNRYDLSRSDETKFSTYAYPWIYKCCQDAVAEVRGIPIPTGANDIRARAERTRDYLYGQLQREPSIEEIVEEMNEGRATLDYVRALLSIPDGISLDRQLGNEGGEEGTLYDVTADPDSLDPLEILVLREEAEESRLEADMTVPRLLALLEPQQREMVELVFGFTGENLEFVEVCERMGVGVRQGQGILSGALYTMRDGRSQKQRQKEQREYWSEYKAKQYRMKKEAKS